LSSLLLPQPNTAPNAPVLVLQASADHLLGNPEKSQKKGLELGEHPREL
jgi:hypothetical protein